MVTNNKQKNIVHKISVGVNTIPSLPGVYFFKNTKGEIIYIGKAVNLKARVKSYFIKNNLSGIKASMLPEIAKIDHKTTDTEIDALILESQLIKKYRPKYNVMLKDDKNYFYVIITGDKFPKVFITHQINKFQVSSYKLQVLGPYTNGIAIKTTLRYLRKIFPFCTCKSTHKLPCLKSHLGLCPGFCCLSVPLRGSALENGKKQEQEYNKNIKSIIDILSGKRKNILKKLAKEIKIAAKNEDFEKAAELRNKISALENIFQHKIPHYRGSTSIVDAKSEVSRIFGEKINRIEFYDISNIAGQLAVGSMIVFDGEKLNNQEYRKFKIKSVLGPDDPAMMAEVLARRLNHAEWPMPDLIIVDGGITQFLAAQKVIKQSGVKNIKITSLAKKPDRLFLSPSKPAYAGRQIALKSTHQNTALFLQNLRDEAHRFAIKYHRILRAKNLKKQFGK